MTSQFDQRPDTHRMRGARRSRGVSIGSSGAESPTKCPHETEPLQARRGPVDESGGKLPTNGCNHSSTGI